MSYYIIVDSSELYHHGVKGMKWGVRHDRKTLGNSRIKIKNPMDSYRASLKNTYKSKYEMTDKEAEAAAQEHARRVRNVAIGAAVVTGAAVGTTLAMKYGRMYGDDIIRKGTEIQTVHANSDIIKTGKFYTTNKKLDKIKYVGMFGEDSPGVAKTRITADVESNIRSIGVKNGTRLYNKLVKTNPEFAEAVKPGGGAAKYISDTIDYKKFNHYALLGDGRYAGIKDAKRAQEIFYDAAKKKGYGAIADWNDRVNSGFNTHANIVFDNTPIKNIQKHSMSMDYVNKQKWNAIWLSSLEGFANPSNMVGVGAVAGYLGSKRAGKRADKKISKKYKKKPVKKEVISDNVFYWNAN